MVTNCKNRGAPLVNGKCEYCRTEYSHGNEEGITLYADHVPIVTLYQNSILTPNETRKLYGFREV